MTVTAVVDRIGDQAHPLSQDCDLHVPLRSREIRVAAQQISLPLEFVLLNIEQD